MTVRTVLTPRLGFMLVGLLLVGANLRASITAVGPVLIDIKADLGLTAAAAGVLGSVPLIAFGLFSPIAPPIAARLGLERTLWLSVVALAAGIVLRSMPVVGALWVGTALLGAAIAFINVLLPSVVKRDFPHRVASITGAYTVTQTIMAAIASMVAVPLAGQAQDGWRLAIGIWAGLALIAAGVFLPQLRASNLRAAPVPDAAPPDAAPPDAALPDAARPAPRPAHPAVAQHPLAYRSPWRSAIGWQVTAFMGLQSMLFYVVINWLPAIEQGFGVSPAEAGVHLFIFQIAGTVGNVVSAALIHRMRDQRLLGLGCSVVDLVAVAGILMAPQFLVLWVALAGLGAGSSILLALSMFGLRTRHHQQTAALSGMAQSLGYLLAATGPVVIGALHDSTGGWVVPLQVLCGVLVVQGVFGLLAGRARTVD
jgi:CP family cyanate transporter-like MFS transporter